VLLHATTPFGGANTRIESVHCALHVHGEKTAQAKECFEVPTVLVNVKISLHSPTLLPN
jgi:hypothetical protein